MSDLISRQDLLALQPSLNTSHTTLITIPIYGNSRLVLLATVLKAWNVLRSFEFEYSTDPSIFIRGQKSPRTFDSPLRLWETLNHLYETATGGSKVIEIKTERKYFDLIQSGFKLNELRKNDRDYQVGDYVILGEVDQRNGYTGRAIGARINWLLAESEAERWMLPKHCNFGLSEIIIMDLERYTP